MNILYSVYKDNSQIKFKEPFNLESSNEIVYGNDFHKLGEFIINISEVLIKLKLLNYTKEFRIGICVPREVKTKFNTDDKETTLQSMIALVHELKVYNPIHYVFFEYNDFEDNLTDSFKPLRAPIHIWQTETRWRGDGNFICVKESRNKDWMLPADMSPIIDQACELGLQVKTIKYGMTIADQIDLLSRCKCLVTERGGQILLSTLIGTPFILCSAEPEALFERNGELGTMIFESDTLGMNPDTKTLVNDKVCNKRFDNSITVADYCNNDNILKQFIQCRHKPDLQKQYVLNNFEIVDVASDYYVSEIKKVLGV